VAAKPDNAGRQAEQQAGIFLQRQGLTILQRNYRCRYGEIDLIMRDGNMIVFVEVRLRSNKNYGGAAASIDANKQGKLLRAAQSFLATLKQMPPCRFDVVLLGDTSGSGMEWIKHAFTA
jgi:putative endonuclease